MGVEPRVGNLLAGKVEETNEAELWSERVAMGN